MERVWRGHGEGTEMGMGYTAVPDRFLPFEVVHERTRSLRDQ